MGRDVFFLMFFFLQECCESLGLSKGFVEKQTGRDVGMNRFGTLQMCNHIFLNVC